jgi:hypothetical protein
MHIQPRENYDGKRVNLMAKFQSVLSVVLKLAPIILACIASNNWAQLQSPEGIDALKALLYVFLPSAVGVASAGGAFYVDSREKKQALLTEPPVVATADETLVSLDAPGVSLRARLDNKSAVDPEFRKRVCAAVQNALEVRATEVKK